MESGRPSTSAAAQLNDSFSDLCSSQLNTSNISLSPAPEVTALERAFSYFIYDEDKVERTESSINKFAAVTYIGQTVDLTGRQSQHKHYNRLEGKAKMIIINDYKGKDAIQKSLEDEFAAYKLVKGNPKIFTNMHPKADAGTMHYIQQSAKAYSAATPARQKLLLTHLAAAMRKGEPWTNEKIHQCPDCKQMFGTKSDLKKHQHEQHQNLEFPCGHCNYVAYKQDHLITHMKLHAKSKPSFTCTFAGCGKTFTSQAYLKQHALTHSTERERYVCEEPGCYGNKNKGPKDYADRGKLKRHMIDDHQLEEEDVDKKLAVQHHRKKRTTDNLDPKEMIVIEKKPKSI